MSLEVISVQLKFFLYQKDLNFFLTANKIDQAKLKNELEEYGGKNRLMWHFRYDKRVFSQESLKLDLTLNSRKNDAVIETNPSCLEERPLNVKIPSNRFNKKLPKVLARCSSYCYSY